MTTRTLLAFLLLTASALANADADLQKFVEQTLGDARTHADLPAVATLVQIDGKVEAQAAIGVRAVGHRQSVTLDDTWYLGDDTKAMTATLMARLVEQGYFGFDDSMAKLFPGIAARMNPVLHDVTVAQLLNHTAGLPPLTAAAEMPAFLAVINAEKGVRAQRAALVVYYLSHPPASKVGEFSYSNLGYTIAGAIAEDRTGRSWEDLIRSEVWKPLGVRHAGFGPPGHSGRFDQPQGHELRDGKYAPVDPEGEDSDNPPAVGPSGSAHMQLREWLLFVQDQLDGEHGTGKLLKPESYRRLHSAMTRNYAMGWGILRGADGAISLLSHAGSNGFWVADMRIIPKRNLILLITTNAGGEAAEKADRDIGRALQDHLKAFD